MSNANALIIEKDGKRYKVIEIIDQTKEWMAIPELGIEVSSMREWTKPYKEISIPKGCELISFSQALYIWETEKYRVRFFADYLKNPKWLRLWCNQLWNDKKKDNSRGLCLDGYLGLYSDDRGLAYSNLDGRVAFVRPLKNKKVKHGN